MKIVIVDDEATAVDYREHHGNVIALIIDSHSSGEAPEAWLKNLRAHLASSGLPGLFVLRDGTADLHALLEHHEAPFVSLAETHTDELPAAETRLLQGNH